MISSTTTTLVALFTFLGTAIADDLTTTKVRAFPNGLGDFLDPGMIYGLLRT
jgi:hypothetical protein